MAQVAALAANKASPIGATEVATAADAHTEAKDKADALVAISTEPDLNAEKAAWLTQRVTELKTEHAQLEWLRDNPQFDPNAGQGPDGGVDRAEQVRQVEAAIQVAQTA